ncbi:MAG: sensor histidine kinase [Acidobacteria bacterium]|nr:sensor histidine kinase [Acidobacteriota bacterium]
MLGIKKGGDRERAEREFDQIAESATQALEEVREITNNLRPQLLDRLGLTKAINSMLKSVEDVVEVESAIDSVDGVFSENEEICVYRIVQESLNNVLKHAHATRVSVIIERAGTLVSIRIKDNGRGFDPAAAKNGLGLVGLKERTLLLNGELKIDSAIGEGTGIDVRIPTRMD